MLSDKIESYKSTGKFAAVTPARYKKEYPYLKEVDSLALCNVQLNLQTAYNKSFSVQNAAHSAEVVNAAKADLETLYNGAADIAAAYATATAAINALEAIEDKGGVATVIE